MYGPSSTYYDYPVPNRGIVGSKVNDKLFPIQVTSRGAITSANTLDMEFSWGRNIVLQIQSYVILLEREVPEKDEEGMFT